MPLGTEVCLGPHDIMLDRDPSPLKGAQHPHFSAHVYCGQTAGWIKMPLGAEIDLGPGHIVLDRDPAPPREGNSTPLFMSIMAERWPISATAELLYCKPTCFRAENQRVEISG